MRPSGGVPSSNPSAGGSSGNPWLPMRPEPPGERVRLFCFPYAGAGASVFYPWVRKLEPRVAVWPVQLPGREQRLRERPFAQVAPLIDRLMEVLPAFFDRPFAFFGHSMGAIIAYALAQRLNAEGRTLPVHLFVAARPAPHLPARAEPIHKMDRQRFVEKLKTMGGTPGEVLDNRDLMQFLEPLLRADLELNETFLQGEGPHLTCPITALGGAEDGEADEAQMAAWREATRGPFEVRIFPAGHFFINDAMSDVLRVISQALASV